MLLEGLLEVVYLDEVVGEDYCLHCLNFDFFDLCDCDDFDFDF